MSKLYLGLSLSDNSNNDSGLAIINEDNEIVQLEKFYKMHDVEAFFNNYENLKELDTCVSLAWLNAMLNGKWRILSKPYQILSGTNIQNRDNWAQRYSNRGREFFTHLAKDVNSFNRFEVYLTRQSMNLSSGFKERTPADCKYLQSALQSIYHIQGLPSNMMAMSQLEAIVGALLAKKAQSQKPNVLFEFNDAPVINI